MKKNRQEEIFESRKKNYSVTAPVYPSQRNDSLRGFKNSTRTSGARHGGPEGRRGKIRNSCRSITEIAARKAGRSDLLLANNPPCCFLLNKKAGLFVRKFFKNVSKDPGFGVFKNSPQLSKLFPEKKISRPSAEDVEQQGGYLLRGGVICYQ